jgi:hypothetical protein
MLNVTVPVGNKKCSNKEMALAGLKEEQEEHMFLGDKCAYIIRAE